MARSVIGAGTRERLLMAADLLFYNEGIHVVGIDRVLEEAEVAKASLYSIFGNKEELVREYLRERSERARHRIRTRIAYLPDARAKLLAVFDAQADRVSMGAYYGCPFIRASAEGAPGPTAAREISLAHRAWFHGLLEDLAREAGAADPVALSRQLSFLYDGAATSVGMEENDQAPLLARRAAERLLDAELPAQPTRKKRAR